MKIRYQRYVPEKYVMGWAEVRPLTYHELRQLPLGTNVYVYDFDGKYKVATIHGYDDSIILGKNVSITLGDDVRYITSADDRINVYIENEYIKYMPDWIELNLTVLDKEKLSKFLDIVGIDIDNVGDTFQHIYSKALGEYLSKNYQID